MWSEMCVTVLFLQCRSLLQTWKHLLWHTQSRLICVAGQLCVLLLPSSSHKWCFMAPFIYFITRVPDILGSVMIFGESWDVATEGGGQKGGGRGEADRMIPPPFPRLKYRSGPELNPASWQWHHHPTQPSVPLSPPPPLWPVCACVWVCCLQLKPHRASVVYTSSSLCAFICLYECVSVPLSVCLLLINDAPWRTTLTFGKKAAPWPPTPPVPHWPFSFKLCPLSVHLLCLVYWSLFHSLSASWY